MPPSGVISISDGNSIQVSDLVANPMFVPARVTDRLKQGFISSALMRNAGPNIPGIVTYEESRPLFLRDEVESVSEFAEIPVGVGQRGVPRVAFSTKKGLAIRISKEMRDEGRIGEVNQQIVQLTNTMLRDDERAFRQALSDPTIPTIAASVAWDQAGAKIRRDISLAQEKIGSASTSYTGGEDTLGFEADTVVFPGGIVPLLLDNEDFLKVYRDTLADQNVAYTGRMPGEVMGLAPLKSRSWPKDRVLVLERNTVGFYSDSRPLQVTPLYSEGGGPNGGPTESWRSDATKKRVLACDQPKAACWITGITTP